MKTEWVLATRGSKLALWQADFVKQSLLQAFPEFSIQIRVIQTTGDRARGGKLWTMGGKGVFTKEIEDALLDGSADLAVHSLKDLPTELPEGLKLGAIPIREECQDVLISKDNVRFEYLLEGSKIGTSSLRRQAQILHLRPDLKMENVRGNVHTRIKKVYGGPLDAVVMAKAGLVRLGLQEWMTQEFNLDEMLPAVGQGALAVEIRSTDKEAEQVMKAIGDDDLFCTATAERSFLKALGGGCRLPIAAYAQVNEDQIDLEGLVIASDGKDFFRHKISGIKKEAENLGHQLAQWMLEQGAGKLLPKEEL